MTLLPAKDAMRNARGDVINLNNGKREILVSCDCTWAKRGFHSNCGMMVCCSPFDTNQRKRLESF